MSDEDLEYYYQRIDDARANPDEVKKVIKQIWEDAQAKALNSPPEQN